MVALPVNDVRIPPVTIGKNLDKVGRVLLLALPPLDWPRGRFFRAALRGRQAVVQYITQPSGHHAVVGVVGTVRAELGRSLGEHRAYGQVQRGALDHVGDAQAVGVLHGALLPVVREARHA